MLSLDTSVKPTCIAAISPHNNNNSLSNTGPLIAASFTDGSIAIYNIEGNSTNQRVLAFEDGSPSRINSIVVHPTLPVLVSAHEDRQIKFWDLNNGEFLMTLCRKNSD